MRLKIQQGGRVQVSQIADLVHYEGVVVMELRSLVLFSTLIDNSCLSLLFFAGMIHHYHPLGVHDPSRYDIQLHHILVT